MGNCIMFQRPVSWVDEEDDDWGSAAGGARCGKDLWREEEGNNGKETGSREIRIKISKKQLEELLRQVDGEGLQLRRVLADLAGLGGDAGDRQLLLHEHERHWRPKLQSIPEVAEYV